MEDNFKLEIISPEKIIFSDNTKIATLPSYEGDMSILKNHISIITFLRPGIIRVQKKEGDSELTLCVGASVRPHLSLTCLWWQPLNHFSVHSRSPAPNFEHNRLLCGGF